MRNTIIFLSLLLSTVAGFGQIDGKVVDSVGEPMGFANVVLYEAEDTSFVKGVSTAEDGTYSIDYAGTGEFFLQVSSIGYELFQSDSFSKTSPNQLFQLPQIVLLEESNGLVEVVVSAKKNLIQSTPNGKIFNIQSSLMTKGSNALQILERLPGVILDRRYNQFSLNGQSGVTILFNGRRVQMSMEELMALLESTVADNIEKIELITSPTAQYDADGGAGIINIVFKKNAEEGTKVNFSTTVGYGYREKATSTLGVSKGFRNVTFQSSYSYLRDVGKSGFGGYGTSDGIVLKGESMSHFSNLGERSQNTHNLNLATEINISPKIIVGADLSSSLAKADNLAHIENIWDVKDVEYIGMKALSDGSNKRQNLISSIYFKNKFSDESQLDFDVSYIGYKNHSPAFYQAEYFDRQGDGYIPQNEIFTSGIRGESLSTIGVGVVKADYSQELNNKINVAVGVKGSYTQNSNDSKVERNMAGVWETDPRSQSIINGEEKILAGYSQLKILFNEKSSLQAGLRYEYWQREINIYQDDFAIAKLFPSFLYTYSFNERNNISFNYNRRISRPAYEDLISNLFYNDPTAIFTGNPLLKPGITDAIKADLNLKGFNIGLSLQKEINPIIRYQLTANEANDILIVSPQNIDFQKSINLNISGPIKITDWWDMTLGSTSSLRKYKISYSVMPAEKTYLFQNVNFSQHIKLPKNLEMELSGWYNFPFYDGSNKLKGFGVVNFGLAKKLKNEKGTLQLALPDLFQTFSVHTHISGMTPIVFNINTHATWRDESARYRIVKLTFTRNFGKNTRSVNYHSDDEERKRIR